MEARVNNTLISLVRGDITLEATDAIVNAANERLAGGGGVDGAIHSAGGPAIMEECGKIGSCPTGTAVITTGGNLKSKFVIHTVGPIYRDGAQGEPRLLESAYRSSLALAAGNGLKSVAFPSISTGVYGYPIEAAAKLALSTVMDFLKKDDRLELVRFVLFSDRDLAVYSLALSSLI